MKYVKTLFALVLMLAVCTTAYSKKKKNVEKPVYAFGVSASFTDTVVYYTNIHVIDSVFLDNNGFLPNRELYSYQLKNYMEIDCDQPNRTCMIYFKDNKKKLEKEYSKLLARYKKNKNVSLKEIEADKFRFKKADVGEEE